MCTIGLPTVQSPWEVVFLSIGTLSSVFNVSFSNFQAIFNAQKTSVPGDLISVPGATEKISFLTCTHCYLKLCGYVFMFASLCEATRPGSGDLSRPMTGDSFSSSAFVKQVIPSPVGGKALYIKWAVRGWWMNACPSKSSEESCSSRSLLKVLAVIKYWGMYIYIYICGGEKPNYTD